MAIETATQVSIERKSRKEQGIAHGAAAWMVAAVDRVGRALTWIFERMPNTHGCEGKQMRLVESLALGNRRQLLLVVCGNRRYLVGAGADGVGGILAMESASGVETGIESRAGARSRSQVCKGKGPELVRRGVPGIASKTDAGTGVWQ